MLQHRHDVPSYVRRVRGFLEAHEAENGLFLGSLESLLQPGGAPERPPFLAFHERDGQVDFAAMYWRVNLLLSRGPSEYCAPLVDLLARESRKFPGALGPVQICETFAAEWARFSGCRAKIAYRQRIYELRTVIAPRPTAGQARQVAAGDLALVTDWIEAFEREALPHSPVDRATVVRNSENRVRNRTIWFWEVEGRPVTMANLARPTTRGITVNSVYTPPEHRGRGYASQVVAEISRQGLAQGKSFCTLYTDLSNPTSNSIYQKLGYRSVCDSVNFQFVYG